jgi:hypothetical protein
VRVSYEYSLIRVVPSVEREEFVNAGVLIFCESRSVLRATIELNEARLLALCPRADLSLIRTHLAGFECICRGGAEAGPFGLMPIRERWRWITAPRNTILQTSPAHGGLTDDIDAIVEHMMTSMVRCPT